VALGELVQDGSFLPAFIDSNMALLVGYSLTLVLGTLMGLMMGSWRLVDHSLGPYLQVLLVTPVVAVVPIIIVLFANVIGMRLGSPPALM